MVTAIRRHNVHLVSLDPTRGGQVAACQIPLGRLPEDRARVIAATLQDVFSFE